MTLTYSPRDDQVDEIATRIFQPDTLVTYEYDETSRRATPIEPEKHLMHAVLEDAINMFQLHLSAKTRQQRRLFLDAQTWIWAKQDDWPFSFENICAVLGLDPQFLRNGLSRWRDRYERESGGRPLHYPRLRRAGQ
jgi:hypothetical protein